MAASTKVDSCASEWKVTTVHAMLAAEQWQRRQHAVTRAVVVQGVRVWEDHEATARKVVARGVGMMKTTATESRVAISDDQSRLSA